MSQDKNEKPKFDFKAVFESEDYLYFYGDALTEERTKKEINFLVKKLKLNKSMKILDLACGNGIHTIGLAELGYNVTGIDNNSDFLEIAQKEAKNKSLNVEFIQKDMRKIVYKEKFDRIFLLFTSFGYFDDNENLKVLKNIANALKPEGLFCLDTMNRDIILKHFLPYVVVEKGNDLMIDRFTFESVTGRLYNKRIVIRNGKRKDKPYFVRFYNLNEIRDLLKRTKFRIHKIFGDWDAKPFNNNSKRMILIIKKIIN